ncbi:MAG TPA: hypothetical protein VG454_12065 [Gemmatimonadales bacterium]|nr:hypothetical protein [Gemmatimonadales bacterium]
MIALPLVSMLALLGLQVQSPVRVAIGFGVDTLGTNHEIFTLWRSYLSSAPGCSQNSSLWSASEQAQWPVVDLLCSYVYQGFTGFTVVHLAPAVGLDSTYMIRTLVATVSDSGHDVQPLALYRVYATRERGRWVLANALPRLTRDWSHETIGRVRFVFPPGHRFARERASATAAFVDSLAAAFAISPPVSIGYYFTDDLIQTLSALGLEFFPLGADTVGGRSNAPDRLVFVGSSSHGEEYRHELAHVVLEPFVASFRPSGLVREGLMTWTGGSAGLTFQQLMPGLKGYLDAHPEVTLERILTDPPPRVGTLDVGYDGLAVLCKMVYDAAGIPGVRELMSAGREPRAVVDTAAHVLNVAPARLDPLWRRRVSELAR